MRDLHGLGLINAHLYVSKEQSESEKGYVTPPPIKGPTYNMW
jgi:hypothetical protein